jgi:hypothetical protein
MPDWLVSGFSLVGVTVVVLQQLPGIVWAIRPPKVDPFAQNSGTPLVEVLEKSFGIGTILLLAVVIAKAPLLPDLHGVFLIGAFGVLAVYYAFYAAYYLGVTRLTVLLGMAAFPPLSFLLVALHQGNYPALLTNAVFGVVHVGLTYANFGPGGQRSRGRPPAVHAIQRTSGSASARESVPAPRP